MNMVKHCQNLDNLTVTKQEYFRLEYKTVKSQNCVRYIFFVLHTSEKVLNLISLCFEAVDIQRHFVLVRKLVQSRTNQFQVKCTKMGPGSKFVTLQ